jgi:hypothetical protein
MIGSIRAKIRRRVFELSFLVATVVALFAPGVPYRSFAAAAVPVFAWLLLDRLWRLRADLARLRRLRGPYLLKVEWEDL